MEGGQQGRSAEDARAEYERNPEASAVLHQFGEWFVTDFGVEGLNRGSIYPIPADRLWEDHERGSSWEDHLVAKTWVTNHADMRRALAKGREVHASKRGA